MAAMYLLIDFFLSDARCPHKSYVLCVLYSEESLPLYYLLILFLMHKAWS